jgi:predicted lipoprotein with Yx(FWY)xxD motif
MSQVQGAFVKGVRLTVSIAALLTLSVATGVAVAALARPTTVTTHQTKRGKVLAAANGHSLYLFSADIGSKSTCYGSCATPWRPLLTSSRPVAAAGSGVSAKLLGTTRRTNHTLQVTYKGHPLYQFAGDKSPGEITGEGVNQFKGHWYLVNTGGNAVKPRSGGGCPPGYVRSSTGCVPQTY